MDRVFLEIDKKALLNNINNIKNKVKKDIIAVIKANAYGLGAAEIASLLESVDFVKFYAVACIEEAIELRSKGIKKDILILGGIFSKEEVKICKDMNFIPSISTYEQLSVVKNSGLDFHVKFDTGMGRLGFFVEEAEKLLPYVRNIKGIMTHLSSPLDRDYTFLQLKRFERVLKFFNVPFVHVQSSSFLGMDIPYANLIRIGLSMYGEKPLKSFNIEINPIYRFKARVISIKEFKKGDRISYAGTYIVQRNLKVGVISAGYADGIPKALSNNWYVFFNGKALKMIGNITMDMCMFEASSDIKVGDEVEVFNKELSFSKASKIVNTIPYELMCHIGKRVKRVIA